MAKRLIYLPDPTIKFYTKSPLGITTFCSFEIENQNDGTFFEIDFDNDADFLINENGDERNHYPFNRFEFILDRLRMGEMDYFPKLINRPELFEVMDI